MVLCSQSQARTPCHLSHQPLHLTEQPEQSVVLRPLQSGGGGGAVQDRGEEGGEGGGGGEQGGEQAGRSRVEDCQTYDQQSHPLTCTGTYMVFSKIGSWSAIFVQFQFCCTPVELSWVTGPERASFPRADLRSVLL